jgi:ent-kaurenoic acid hydroxylase
MWWLWWAAVAALAVAVLDAGVRTAHAWYWTASLGGERRRRLPPGDMGWPLVGGMWAFLRAFKSGKPDAFIDSFRRR